MNSRDSFLFYRSYLEAAQNVTDEQKQSRLIMAILHYGIYFEEPDFSDDEILKVAWSLIKPLLDASHRNYGNGKKGGAPKGNQNARKTTEKQPKTTQNNRETTENKPKQGKDKVKDKDKDKVNGKDKYKDKEKDKDKVKDNNTPLTPHRGEHDWDSIRKEFPDEDGWEDP